MCCAFFDLFFFLCSSPDSSSNRLSRKDFIPSRKTLSCIMKNILTIVFRLVNILNRCDMWILYLHTYLTVKRWFNTAIFVRVRDSKTWKKINCLEFRRRLYVVPLGWWTTDVFKFVLEILSCGLLIEFDMVYRC